MADAADESVRQQQAEIASLQQRRRGSGPPATGRCLYCGEPLQAPGHRWCDVDCRDDYEREVQRNEG